MASGKYKGKLLQSICVERKLARQPLKCVASALNFITVEVAVENSQVDTALRMGETKFINDQNVFRAI